MSRNRWIMYAFQNFPGNMVFRVTCHESLEWCKDSLERFSRAVYTDEVSATLYPFSEADWQSAREYESSGCPFDYPSKIIERGPRGGFKIENC